MVAIAAAVWFLVVPHFMVRHEGSLPSNGDLGAACGDPGVAYTSATAYAGSGPHVTAVYGKSGQTYTSSLAPSGLPVSWRPVGDNEIQLVVCFEKLGKNGYLDTVCDYGPNGHPGRPSANSTDLSMNDTVYRATLWELRTHRKVAEAELDGADTTVPGDVHARRRRGGQPPVGEAAHAGVRPQHGLILPVGTLTGRSASRCSA